MLHMFPYLILNSELRPKEFRTRCHAVLSNSISIHQVARRTISLSNWVSRGGKISCFVFNKQPFKNLIDFCDHPSAHVNYSVECLVTMWLIMSCVFQTPGGSFKHRVKWILDQQHGDSRRRGELEIGLPMPLPPGPQVWKVSQCVCVPGPPGFCCIPAVWQRLTLSWLYVFLLSSSSSW